MIGVALFLAPWIIVRAAFVGVVHGIRRFGGIASSDAARPRLQL